jgi:hypothetical protein
VRARFETVLHFGAAARAGDPATVDRRDTEAVVRAVQGFPVKVILEAAALTDGEKRLRVPNWLDPTRAPAFVQDVDRLPIQAAGATIADVRLDARSRGVPRPASKASGLGFAISPTTLADDRKPAPIASGLRAAPPFSARCPDRNFPATAVSPTPACCLRTSGRARAGPGNEHDAFRLVGEKPATASAIPGHAVPE